MIVRDGDDVEVVFTQQHDWGNLDKALSMQWSKMHQLNFSDIHDFLIKFCFEYSSGLSFFVILINCLFNRRTDNHDYAHTTCLFVFSSL